MAYELQNQLTPSQIAILTARRSLEDSFTAKELKNFSVLSKNIVPYLTDHFLLMNDLRSSIQEENRKCYFDYSFVVMPVHKAFESYLEGFLSFVFDFKISRDKNEGFTVGYYLKYPLEKKNVALDKIEKTVFISKINRDSWIERWEGLKNQWNANRNTPTHPEGGNIPTLRQAEQIAGSILREMQLSIDLFDKEYISPLLEWYEKNHKKTEEKQLPPIQ